MCLQAYLADTSGYGVDPSAQLAEPFFEFWGRVTRPFRRKPRSCPAVRRFSGALAARDGHVRSDNINRNRTQNITLRFKGSLRSDDIQDMHTTDTQRSKTHPSGGLKARDPRRRLSRLPLVRRFRFLIRGGIQVVSRQSPCPQ